jgi:hypothetical protein
MAKKMAFGGVKKMRGGGTSSRGTASSPSSSKPAASSSKPAATPSKPAASSKLYEAKYTGLRDMVDGGGPGKSGSTFSGGPLASVSNSLGIKPVAPRVAPSGGGGGADSGQAAARADRQREAYEAVRDYKGNPDNFGGKGPSAAPAAAEVAASEAAMVPKKVMKRTYMGAPPKGYDAGKQGEYTYFKSEMVDAPAKPMKKGGKVRGGGCAQRGMRPAKMV